MSNDDDSASDPVAEFLLVCADATRTHARFHLDRRSNNVEKAVNDHLDGKLILRYMDEADRLANRRAIKQLEDDYRRR